MAILNFSVKNPYFVQKAEITLTVIAVTIAVFLIALAIYIWDNSNSNTAPGMMGEHPTNNNILPISLIAAAAIVIVVLVLYLIYFKGDRSSSLKISQSTQSQTSMERLTKISAETEDLRPFEIFLCYKKSSGRDFADHLKTGLEELGFHTFEDCRDIPQTVDTEEGWACVRDKALTESRFFIVIMTSGFDLSKEVIKELAMARTLGDKTFIFFRHRSLGRNIVVHLENEDLDIGKLEQVSFESKEELLRLAHNILLKSQ
jgi:uncharacterized membrane protein